MAAALDTLEYARRLREAGLTEELAEGHAQALAAAMTESLATKSDLRELEVRTGARFDSMSTQIAELERRIELRLGAMSTQIGEAERRMDLRLGERLADVERRMTVRLLAGIAVVSALVRLL